jgi:hypothetical protein
MSLRSIAGPSYAKATEDMRVALPGVLVIGYSIFEEEEDAARYILHFDVRCLTFDVLSVIAQATTDGCSKR